MATPRSKASRKGAAPDGAASVDAFLLNLDHPHKDAVEALREVVLGSDPRIAQGIKWNAPSFRTEEYFATTHLRAKIGIGLILHLGAKPRENALVEVDDPHGLIAWLAADRAALSFADVGEVRSRADAVRAIIRQWITYL